MRVSNSRWTMWAGLAATALLGGCVMAPPAYDVGEAVAYPAAGYTTYYDGGPVYGYPYAWGPNVSVGVYRGWGGPRWNGGPPPWGYGPGPRPGGAGPWHGPWPGGARPAPGPRPGGAGPGPRPGPRPGPIGLGPGPGLHTGGAVSAPVPRGRTFDMP